MIRVVLDGTKKIYGLDQDQTSRIKDDLLLDNPAYLSAKKYSRYRDVSIDRYLQYFLEYRDCLEVPAGYQLPYEVDEFLDNRVERRVDYPQIKIKLRDTQRVAVKEYLKDTNNGMICMPTGKGKSILGIYLAYLLRQRCLIIVHKDDLVDGWMQDINMCFGGEVTPGIIKAKKRYTGEQFTISTVQTLNRLSDEEINYLYDYFGIVITDECHHVPASSYSLLSCFCAQYKIGLTATPERKDGLQRAFNFYLNGFAYVHTEVADDEDILPVKVVVQNSKINFMPEVSAVYNRFGDIIRYRLLPEGKSDSGSVPINSVPFKMRPRILYSDIEDLVFGNPEFKETVANNIIKEFVDGRSIIVFFSQKKHCRDCFDMLVDNGVPADTIQLFYGDNNESSSVIKERAESGKCKITITTYAKGTEGTNVRAWEVAFLVSSLNDPKNVQQAIGRIRRVKENKINPVMVYDYRHPNVYMLNNHGRTRDSRYKDLDFTITFKNPQGAFTRGLARRIS
jgi:superfamily II DNA or RNA helicase